MFEHKLSKNNYYVVIVNEAYIEADTGICMRQDPPVCIEDVYSSVDEVRRSLKAHYPKMFIDDEPFSHSFCCDWNEDCEYVGKAAIHYFSFYLRQICTDIPIEFVEGKINK